MKNQPTFFFLDLGSDPLETISNDFNSLLSVTWSKDNATGDGLEYVSMGTAENMAKEFLDYAAVNRFSTETIDELFERFKKL